MHVLSANEKSKNSIEELHILISTNFGEYVTRRKKIISHDNFNEEPNYVYVGSGKTTTLRKIRDTLSQEKEIIVAKSISIEKKTRVTLSTLIVALFYDLSTEKESKIPTQTEKKERKLQKLIKKRKMPVALFIDEAHDLHGNILIGIKRLIEMVHDCGGIMSVVLAVQNKSGTREAKRYRKGIEKVCVLFTFYWDSCIIFL